MCEYVSCTELTELDIINEAYKQQLRPVVVSPVDTEVLTTAINKVENKSSDTDDNGLSTIESCRDIKCDDDRQ